MPKKNPEITENTALQLRGLGLRIRRQRKALKVSATVAAESAGMSRVTWHRIEKGEPAVTMGNWVNAMAVLGLTFGILDPDRANADDREGLIPARIRLEHYPQLRQLAWHIRKTDTLSPGEALDIYERNRRHLDMDAMAPEERQLHEALRQGFGKEGDENI